MHFTALRFIQYCSLFFCLVPCTMVALQDLILKNLASMKFIEAYSDMKYQFSFESYTIILSGFL